MMNFFAHLVLQRTFLAAAATSSFPGHSKFALDGIFGSGKELTDCCVLSSLPHLQQKLSGTKIEVRELTFVLDLHSIPRSFNPPQISSTTKLFAWRYFAMGNGVHFQGRQFLGSKAHDDSDGTGNGVVETKTKKRARTIEQAKDALASLDVDPAEDWLGTQDLESALILPSGSTWQPPLFTPQLSNTLRETINEIITRQDLTRTGDDRAYWTRLRDEHSALPTHFAWPAPLPAKQPFDKEAIMGVVKAIKLSVTELQDIFPVRIKWFWAYAKDKLLAMSKPEAEQRGLGTLRTAMLRVEAQHKKHRASAAQESDDEHGVRRFVVRILLLQLLLLLDSFYSPSLLRAAASPPALLDLLICLHSQPWRRPHQPLVRPRTRLTQRRRKRRRRRPRRALEVHPTTTRSQPLQLNWTSTAYRLNRTTKWRHGKMHLRSSAHRSAPGVRPQRKLQHLCAGE